MADPGLLLPAACHEGRLTRRSLVMEPGKSAMKAVVMELLISGRVGRLRPVTVPSFDDIITRLCSGICK